MKPANCCKHLRAKKMYVPEQADQVFAKDGDQLTFHGHCWCNRTLSEVGFDERQVGVSICNPSRSCFEE